MKHDLSVEYKQVAPGYFAKAGWYLAAWNDRNGHAEGGPFETEAEAEKEGKSWEKDEFE